MEHLSDKQFLDALGRDTQESPVGEHLQQCASCRARLEEFRQTWDVLGQWAVEDRQVDLTDGILRQARSVRSIYVWQPRALLRIAASIIVGIGVGSLSALPMRGQISAEQVSDAMHLDVLAVNSATGLAGPLLAGDVEN
jgi:predicted anti-sigma-YlaC factor YlaD